MKMKKILLLSILISLSFSCSEDDDSSEQPITVSSDIYYVSGKINGEAFLFSMDINDPFANYTVGPYGRSFYSEDYGCSYSYDTGISPTYEESLSSLYLNFNYFFIDTACELQEYELTNFNEIFASQTVNYATDEYRSSGISFEYSPITKEALYYVTKEGDQLSSSFIIEESITNPPLTFFNQFNASQTITGTFNCTLYNPDDLTDTVEITEGKYRLVVYSDGAYSISDLQNL